MGVQNLWVLLAPVGRQIEIESLAGQVLAVDASIWLTQFVKAMRDDEGNMIRNAHVLGTLHRVAKLLFYGVRPVFVFDGQTPEIKKRTTARRRRRQEQQTANLRHTAQRILLNRLKQHRQEMKRNGGAPPAAVAPGVTLPGAENEEQDTLDEEQQQKDADEEMKSGEAEVKKEEKEEDSVWKAAAEEEDEDEHLTLDDIELDTSRLSKIDLHAVFSLPPHLQKDMIQRIQRDRRQEVRDQFIPLAGNPEAYSHTQISAFLETSVLNRRIEAAKRQKKDEEMEKQGGRGLGPGHRIDSNSSRFYIYRKDAENKEPEDKEEDVVAELEQYDTVERDSATGSELLEKSNETQNNRSAAFKTVEKRPLSEFAGGMAGHVPDATAKAVTAAWVARHQVRLKQEPILAIEKVRQNRLKKEGSSVDASAADNQTQRVVSDVSVSVKLEDVDPVEIERFKKLFPGSVVEPAAVKKQKPDEGEDEKVDWEEVSTIPATESITSDSSQHQEVARIPARSNAEAVAQPVPSVDLDSAGAKDNAMNGKDESEEEVEWEDVQAEAVPDEPPYSTAESTISKNDQSSQEQQRSSPETDVQMQEEDLEGDDEKTNELFMTLKNEMEDAKAHEDLDLLKDEALKSAMATASNLTQWAAGAVRRALEAHTQQRGGTHRSPTAAPGVRAGVHSVVERGSAQAPVELSDDENEAASSLTDWNGPEVVVIDEKEKGDENGATKSSEEDLSNEQLQAALAASIAGEKEAAAEQAAGTRVRYLQYAQPIEYPSNEVENSQQEMDPAALHQEQLELKKLRNRQLRDTEGITDEMVDEVMALLRLFGVPFLVSPMEAEAQCAALEQLGLVDGVITDDSDIFPFGGQRVYKNIFHHQKFVEAFSARDIERELGFSREQIIALALLLGSDYTDGVRGIGIVNATEVAAAYPGLEGLSEFKKWVRAFDVAEEAQRLATSRSKKKKKITAKDKSDGTEDEEDGSEDGTTRERFQRSHSSMRRKWELGDEFPSKQVVQAYLAPQVDRSDARFSWTAPDLAALRNYCANAFGWDRQKSDGVLQPLEEKAKEAAANSGRHIQTRLDRFFTSYDDQVRYAQIKSKRLRSAVKQRADNKSKATKKQRK